MDRPFIEYLLNHDALAGYPLAVLDCDYAKAPEHPCPASTDDARDVLDYVFKNPSVYDSKRVTLGGFSAGGCMALGISAQVGLEAKTSSWPYSTSPEHPIKGVIAYYPPINFKPRVIPPVPEGKKFPGVILPPFLTEIFDGAYFYPPTLDTVPSSTQDRERVKELQQNPLISPANGRPEHFPDNVAIITCEYDTLTRDTEPLRRTLQQARANGVYGWTIPEVGHSWDNTVLPGQFGYEERNKAYDLTAKIIARAGGLDVDI